MSQAGWRRRRRVRPRNSGIDLKRRSPLHPLIPATTQRCDIAPTAAGVTDRLPMIDGSYGHAQASHQAISARDAAMKLLVVFIISVLVGQSISVATGLLVERQVTPYAGLLTFIVCYFAVFWLAWRFAVRVPAPGSRVRRSQEESLCAGERGKPTRALLGAYAATEGLNQATLLIEQSPRRLCPRYRTSPARRSENGLTSVQAKDSLTHRGRA